MPTSDDAFARGLAVRKAILGDELKEVLLYHVANPAARVYNGRRQLHRGRMAAHMNITRFLTGAGLAAALSLPVYAHHSFAAEFDAAKPVTLTGSVTKVEWQNPHIWVYLEVKDEQGRVQPWQCEGGAPNTLTRNGWSANSLKSGEPVTIEGVLAKDGSKTCNMRAVKLPDGRTVFAGSSGGDAPPKK